MRASYAEIRERSNRMSGALAALGVDVGDRVGTLAWNTRHHLEIYYATMGMGASVTRSIRGSPSPHLARSSTKPRTVLAVAANLVPLVLELPAAVPAIRHVVVMDEPPRGGAPTACRCGALRGATRDEGRALAMGRFRRGYSGRALLHFGHHRHAEGVLYTHRSNYLHTLRALQADSFAITSRDTVLLAVPMFHANGWGTPLLVPAAGAAVDPARTQARRRKPRPVTCATKTSR